MNAYSGRWVAAELVADRAERWPDRIAISMTEGDLSYAALADRAARVGGGLHELGLRPGDVVATMLEAGGDACAAWHGSSWAGVVEAPINTELRGRFLEHQLNDCGARALIVDGRFLERFSTLELPLLEHVVVVGNTDSESPAGTAAQSFTELLEHEPLGLVRRDETDLACILYTSGTTGASKGVVHTNRSICWISQPYVSRLSLTADDVGYSMFPLFHTMGRCAMVTSSLWVGCPVVLRLRFSVSSFWDDIRRTGTTWFGYFGYGSTELGLATCTTPETIKPGTMGVPVDHLELRVHDELDRPAPSGVRGEIVARPRVPLGMFSGYWNRPDDTLHAFGNLWFHSGDAGFVDEDGHLVFTDRLKDSIRRRGENISSFEVEDAVRTHPDVVECAAYPVPSEQSDDEVMVAVVLEEGSTLDTPSFFEHLFPLMPRFAIPRYVRVVEELPKTPTQRVRKIELREQGITPETIDREALGIHPPR